MGGIPVLVQRKAVPRPCHVQAVHCFSFCMVCLTKGLVHAIIQVYAAAIFYVMKGPSLVKALFQGAQRQWPLVCIPQWELPFVLEALESGSYEPVKPSSIRVLSMKMTRLDKRVGELTVR